MTREKPVTDEMVKAGVAEFDLYHCESANGNTAAWVVQMIYQAMRPLEPNPLTEIQDLDQRLNAPGNKSWVEGELVCERVRKSDV